MNDNTEYKPVQGPASLSLPSGRMVWEFENDIGPSVPKFIHVVYDRTKGVKILFSEADMSAAVTETFGHWFNSQELPCWLRFFAEHNQFNPRITHPTCKVAAQCRG